MKSRHKEIQSVDTDGFCFKSDPYHHEITITYKDGSKEEKTMDAIDIAAKFEKYLSNEDNMHFDYVKKPDY